jgi:two-component system phosphate regulon sensor histidine kinase PhoR
LSEWASRFTRPISISASTLISQMAALTAREWLLIISVTVLVAVFLLFALFLLSSRRFRRRKDKEVASMVSRFVEERDKSEAILTDLDVGILAYSSDGVLINSNPAAKRMLNPEPVAEKLTDFLQAFGQDNGLQAAMLLGTAQASGKISVEDRILRARYKESRFDEGRKAGTIVVLQDITESEREEKQRKDFVANVSHELKTPLTTIKTYSESLLEWGLVEKSADAIRKDLWRIHDDSLRMERLVEDLLLLSSIDSRGIRTRMEQLDFSKLIRQSVDRLQHQAQEKQIELTCFSVARTPFVYVDRTAIERVMNNLISNAIKYTDRGGQIKVYIGYLVDDAYVKVSDSGFGIDREHISQIFNRFYRVDMTGSRMYGGTGLGLSIAKELVELHEGRITVASTLGKGTEFTVLIPIAKKVFTDTVEACRSGWPRNDVLHQSATADLQQLAVELDLARESLSEIEANNWPVLLSKVLFNNEKKMDMSVPILPELVTEVKIEDVKGDTTWPAI